jgi:hypothetical protein
MPHIETLVEDIYALFNKEQIDFNPEFFRRFGDDLTDIMSLRFNEERKGGTLRLSNIGKPDRQLWFEVNDPRGGEKLQPQAHIKFMYGDMQEHLCILLAKLAGHDVEFEQETVEIDGIKGHLDCTIDGCLVDVKSTSRFAFSKFKDGTLLEQDKNGNFINDAFGYIGQLAGYVEAKTPGKDGYFLAVNKDLGHLALLRIPSDILLRYRIRDRIVHVKDMVGGDIPARCYSDVEDGKSGNRKLDIGCSYCARKFACWDNLKTYYYSNGPRYLTRVVKPPKVDEFPPREFDLA